MLNTDLHVADMPKRMTRPDFVRNAMRAVQESMPASIPVEDDSRSLRSAINPNDETASPIAPVRQAPLGAVQTQRSTSAPVMSASESTSNDGRGPQTRSISTTVQPFSYTRAWETEAENALKVSEAFLQTLSVRMLTVFRIYTTRFGPIESSFLRQPIAAIASL
jgi:PH/SEC7 domain-containing protein